MSLTVCCVWVKGQVPFTAEYVIKLHAMARRFIAQPFEFVCLTDQPWALPGDIRTVPIQLPLGLKGWWAKLEVFSPNRQWAGRVLYLDLDTLIVGDLAPVIDFPAPLALAPHAGTFEGKDGKQVIKRFNSSVMVWNGADQTVTNLFTTWTPKVAARLHGDQDWIGEQAWNYGQQMPLAWFPRLSEITGPPFSVDAKVILAKKPKNLEAAKRWPWFNAAWSAA